MAQAPTSAPQGPPSSTEPVETLVVTARKLNVETKIDRKIYTVKDDVQSTFGSVSDVLSAIPSVDVDGDGGVALRGDSNVLILIDGKPSALLKGASAGDNLQSMAAKDIERIEILTTPPPQFKADGAAGVINIITRKRHPSGYSGSMLGSLGSGGRFAGGGTANYGGEKFSASANAGFREDVRQRRQESRVSAQDAAANERLDSASEFFEHLRRQVPSAGLSGEYRFNSHQTLSATGSWFERGGLRTYSQRDSSMDSAGAVTSSTGRESSGHDPQSNYDGTLRFEQKFDDPDESLELSVNRSRSNHHEHYDYTNEAFEPPAPIYYNFLSIIEIESTTEANADYVRPVSGGIARFGYAFEDDGYSNANIAGDVDAVTGAPAIDASLSNDFTFSQRTHSIYGSYEAKSGAWSWLGGVRAEQTTTDVNRYSEVYPSLHVARALADGSTLSLGMSKRIARPDPDNLNPYVDREYTPNLRAGNPDLRPQTTLSFDLGYETDLLGSNVTLTGYCRRNTDGVTDVTEYLENGFSLTTKTNLPRSNAAGLEFSANGRLVSALSYTLSGNAFYSQIDATRLGFSGLRSTTGVNLKAKLDFQPTAADSAQLTLNRTDKRLTPQGMNSAINLVNVGYKHLLSQNLSVVATVSDLFNGQRQQRITATPVLQQVYRRTVAGRVAYVGVVYLFGKTKKDKQSGFDYDQGGQ